MRRMTLGRAGALAAITAALCLAQGGLAAEASAQEYYLDSGSVTVTASNGKQYVTQEGGATDELQTSDTVISQRDAATATANTVAVISGSGQTARVTLGGVNIDVSGAGRAAMSTSGDGDVTVTLSGRNVLKSGKEHAGFEKNGTGNLTITAEDTGQSLYAEGGRSGAGIGGKYRSGASDITVSGGTVTATGGNYGAGIGGGEEGSGSNIAITGGKVVATGGSVAAGIGGGYDGSGSNIAITGGEVTARGGMCGAGIGGGLKLDNDTTINCGSVTVSGCAKLRAQGGTRSQHSEGSGAPIGAGGGRTNDDHSHYAPIDGAEVTPDICSLDTNGWIEYYAADADMATATPTKTVYGTGGHDWGEATYTWSEDRSSCTATHICKRNAEHKETEDATVTAKVTQEKSCTSDELTAYTATFENEAFEAQTVANVKTADADPDKHDWGEATYTWSEDHSSCTARRVCRNDKSHEETETVDAVATVTQERSCTDDELTAYTAAFENAAFATQTAKDVKTAEATGHAPETVPAVAATCTEDGLTEGSRCSVCGTVLTEQKPVPATGHSFTAETAEAKYLKSAATCTEGAVYYKSCSVCGESSKGTENEATFEHGEPDASAHGSLAHVAAKAATAKAEGNTEYWHCAECERYFSDAAGTKEIKLADTVVAKKAEPAKKAKKPALPTTGDGAAAQAAALLVGSLAALGAALAARRRAA